MNVASLVFFIFYYPNTGMGVSNEWISWFYCFVDIRFLLQHCLSVFDYVGVRYFSDSHKRCKYTETCKVVYLLSRRKCVFIDSSVYQREGFPEYNRATFSLFLANPKYMYIEVSNYITCMRTKVNSRETMAINTSILCFISDEKFW